MQCPNCNNTVPEGTVKCGCGYVFADYEESTSAGVTGIASKSNNQNVIVTDIKMQFGSMVVFMVKWVIASIPAMIILFLIGLLVTTIFGVGAIWIKPSLFN